MTVTKKDKGTKKAKLESKVKTKRKSKEELIEERETDGSDNTYTGTVKYYKAKKEFGFISIDEEINFKDLSAKDKIYFMKEDITCESETIGVKKDAKVIFKVYKDSMGLGAMDIMNEDGTPIVFEDESG